MLKAIVKTTITLRLFDNAYLIFAIPSPERSFLKRSFASGFVRISATISLEGTYFKLIASL